MFSISCVRKGFWYGDSSQNFTVLCVCVCPVLRRDHYHVFPLYLLVIMKIAYQSFFPFEDIASRIHLDLNFE